MVKLKEEFENAKGDDARKIGIEICRLQDELANVKEELVCIWKLDAPTLYWQAAVDVLPEDLLEKLRVRIAERKSELKAEIGFDPGEIRFDYGEKRKNSQRSGKTDIAEPRYRSAKHNKGFRGW